MPRVFLLEKMKKEVDLSTAEQYGTICYVFREGDRRCSLFDSERFQSMVVDKLQDLEFDPSNDHVCLAGSVVALVLFTTALSRIHPKFSVLLFSSSMNAYVSRVL